MSVQPIQRVSIPGEAQIPAIDLRWFYGFFMVSGFCGLVYEVVWVRLAMASFGVTTALVSVVIAMFMAGLGLGSWGTGVLARRALGSDGPRALRLYSIAELLVGISSLVVPLQLKLGRLLLQHAGSLGAWQTSGYYVLAGIWIAFALVPWCICMGSTFPLLMAVIRQSHRSAAEHSFSYLYVANVRGALLGVVLSALALIELLGFQGTLYVAGSLNVALSVFAFAISFRAVSSTAAEEPITDSAPPRLYGLSSNTPLILLFITGLVSMGMEVVWIREFTPYMGNVVYTFAGILGVYLIATLAGSRRYRSKIDSRLPGQSAQAWSFLALFAVIPVVAADPRLHLPIPHVDGFRLVAIVLFCGMAGFLTPLLVDAWSSGNPDRAGTAYAVNVVGCIAGPLLAGFWLLPWLGERWSVAALSLPLFGVAALMAFKKPSEEVGFQSRQKPRLKFALAAVAAISLFTLSHDFESSFPVRQVRRDYVGTVISTGNGFDRGLVVNGIGMTKLTPITKYMAHLSLALMPSAPRNGLVICFGMGTTFRSMLSWGIPTTSVDLVPSVPAMFGYYHADAARLTSSPLAQVVIDDGRRFLDSSAQMYDVIVVDPPPPPQAAGSSLLYSLEFYDVVKHHLRKGGVFQTWFPEMDCDAATVVSITKALVQSFPYVRAFRSFDGYGIHLLASMEPITVPASSILAARMPAAAAADFIEWGPQANPQQQFDAVLSHEVRLSDLVARDPRAPAIQDDQPINEYYRLRDWFGTSR
ncbi:MAG: hypothetical protein ABSG51_07010 [Terracidiphilus sp.]|jgi:predicted membrane-bound spermidine synthase